MNIYSKDLNSLLVFNVLYEERNLTKAAERLALSQPALSHRLTKLRNEFNDPLFVRAARGLTVTPAAERYAQEISRLVADLEGLYQTLEPEDFLKKPHKVSLFATDLVEHILVADLLTRTRHEAPALQLAMRDTRGKLPKQELQNGECDIAIAGFFNDVPGGFYQQFLCSHPFVVLAHKDNPHINDELQLNEYLACSHVIVTLSGALNGQIDKTLKGIGRERKVIAGYSSFLAPLELLAKQKDILFTCVKPVADIAIRRDNNFIWHTCPVPLASVDYVQIWHERTHNDPMRKWLRQQIKSIMSEQGTV
ncbi:LysR family transcriptional regulator [Planctobacterium marinum]